MMYTRKLEVIIVIIIHITRHRQCDNVNDANKEVRDMHNIHRVLIRFTIMVYMYGFYIGGQCDVNVIDRTSLQVQFVLHGVDRKC